MPSVTSFKTPRALMSLRLFNGFRVMCEKCEDSEALESFVETLAFKHLGIEVTEPRIEAVCDYVVDLVEQHVELPGSSAAWRQILSYAGTTYASVCLRQILLDVHDLHLVSVLCRYSSPKKQTHK